MPKLENFIAMPNKKFAVSFRESVPRDFRIKISGMTILLKRSRLMCGPTQTMSVETSRHFQPIAFNSDNKNNGHRKRSVW